MRPLLIDDALPAGLELELRARGRRADRVAADATDEEALAAAEAEGAVLVTPFELPRGAAAVAVVRPRGAAARRDAIHRHAHAMAAQRPGSLRLYG
ncbi:MAG TPA: hypothetical protein VM266_16105 [Solirubrobacteraceae bacterium]|nr:hypothetical protein [Solirubrobacteraceae bacterium]